MSGRGDCPLIPPWSSTGLLPPFVGTDATAPAGRSPYLTSALDLVQRFGTSPERIALLEGYLRYRKDLATNNCTIGFQWLDGSFVEHTELFRPSKPVPGDIDVVTFVDPSTLGASPGTAVIQLFDPNHTKPTYHVDAYAVELGRDEAVLLNQTCYWYGLLSHQRGTFNWKGILEIPLDTARDNQAWDLLRQLQSQS